MENQEKFGMVSLMMDLHVRNESAMQFNTYLAITKIEYSRDNV